MKQYRFSIIIERDEDGYVAFCPELQGCYSQGASYEEARQNLEDAIKLHVSDRIASKEEIPSGRIVSLSIVEVAV